MTTTLDDVLAKRPVDEARVRAPRKRMIEEIRAHGHAPRNLTRSETRSWRLHRRIATLLDRERFLAFRPRMRANLDRAARRYQGEPHVTHLQNWLHVVDQADLATIHRLLTGLDRHSIEMREVSPFAGFLTEEQRRAALSDAT